MSDRDEMSRQERARFDRYQLVAADKVWRERQLRTPEQIFLYEVAYASRAYCGRIPLGEQARLLMKASPDLVKRGLNVPEITNPDYARAPSDIIDIDFRETFAACSIAVRL